MARRFRLPRADQALRRHGRARGVDLEVERGELVGLLGPNGRASRRSRRSPAGSCRVRARARSRSASPGRLGAGPRGDRLPGRAVPLPRLAARRRAARAPPALAGSDGGAAERARAARAGRAWRRRATAKVGAMSKGMQQRLGIAQALVGEPRLLMLDEPTSALDPVGRRIVRDLLLELRGRGVAVLLNSHLLSEVERVCDRVAILDDGRIVARGSPAELARARGVEVGRRRAACARSRTRPREQVRRDRRGAGRRGRATSTRCGCCPRRSRTPTSRRSEAGVVSGAAVVAGYALRESRRRRRVFAVVLCSPCVPRAVRARRRGGVRLDRRRLRRRGARRRRPGADRLDAARPGDVHDALPRRVLAVFLTLGAVRGDAERGLLQPLVVRPVGRGEPAGRALRGAGRSSAARTWRSSTCARW